MKGLRRDGLRNVTWYQTLPVAKWWVFTSLICFEKYQKGDFFPLSISSIYLPFLFPKTFPVLSFKALSKFLESLSSFPEQWVFFLPPKLLNACLSSLRNKRVSWTEIPYTPHQLATPLAKGLGYQNFINTNLQEPINCSDETYWPTVIWSLFLNSWSCLLYNISLMES